VTQRRSYEGDDNKLERLVGAFLDNYFRPGELRWKETGLLWWQLLKPDDTVKDYTIRVRRCAKQLNMGGETLFDAVLNMLQQAIRLMVL
jgi:hypothetical protein